MKKFLIFLGVITVPAIAAVVWVFWWSYRNFDNQD